MSREAERRNELYRLVGEAVHLSQVLELYVSALLSIVARRFQMSIDVDGLILRDDKKTLGRLITLLRVRGEMSPDGLALLERALNRRNHIAHRFFNRNTYTFTEDHIFEEACCRLQADTAVIAEAAAMMQGFLEAVRQAFGLAEEKILVQQDILQEPHARRQEHGAPDLR
jgi:hypothetical protein